MTTTSGAGQNWKMQMKRKQLEWQKVELMSMTTSKETTEMLMCEMKMKM